MGSFDRASSAGPQPVPTPSVLFALLALSLAACGHESAVNGPWTDVETHAIASGDLVVVDADGGSAAIPGEPASERSGALWHSRRAASGAFGDVELLLDVPELHELIDVLPVGHGRLLLLESKAPHPDGEGAGGVWLLDTQAGRLRPWLVDPRMRQPVGLARAPDGRLLVSDRGAVPPGAEHAGLVFVVDARHDPADLGTEAPPPEAVGLLTHPDLRAPGALLVRADGRILLLDADANPGGHEGTPGVLFELVPDDAGSWTLEPRLAPSETTSPLGLIEGADGHLYLVDCNEARDGVFADGALFRVDADGLVKLIDVHSLGRPHVLHDPALGDALPDGRLVVADASADPLGLGPDGSKGFNGSGPGAVLALDPQARTVETLLASPRFVTPISVRRVP